jgi:hypothetical protein
MFRITLAVCTFALSACTTGAAPRKSEPVPPALVSAGFTAAECRIVKPAQADVDDGPGGNKFSHGEHGPQVECHHPGQSVITTRSVPVCHTQAGKPLPLAACCMSESGDPIPACTPQVLPPGE